MTLHETIIELLGQLLGLEHTRKVEDYEWSFAALRARHTPLWLLLACVGLATAALVFYLRYQPRRHRAARAVLGVFRAAVLALVVLLLAEPILTAHISGLKRPVLWLLFDGTDSMAIQDELPTAEKNALETTLGMYDAGRPPHEPEEYSRADYLKAFLARDKDKVFARLDEQFRLRPFLFEGAHGPRSLEPAKPGKSGWDGPWLAGQLTSKGQVTAIGAAMEDIARRQGTTNLGGVVILSDFNQNADPPAVPAARQLGVPVYTVGIGATTAADVAVEIQAPVKAKKGEGVTVAVTLRQQGLSGQQARVRVFAEPLGSLEATAAGRVPIGEQTVTLAAAAAASSLQTVEFPYVPKTAGRFTLVAEADPLPGEVVRENNRAKREITVLDDFLRLLFVEYEPTWEWRFIKEVFHRDPLVGMEGFRTYLYSSDPRVRGTHGLFLPTMASSRSKFFAHDVIFLGDLPGSVLSPRFCQMVKEFVADFGGGLVVLAGPRFGPGQLAETPLADLLPVTVDPGRGPDDRQSFAPQLAPLAEQYDFMRLGDTPEETRRAWQNLGLLPWYQPVRRVHPQATVLMEHPTQTCADGKQKQPLMAVRPYGRGSVVYLGFDETWRLRHEYGEKYYRSFWGRMIQHLALAHALGNQKRFVVRTDRRHYQSGDTVTLAAEAYDADFLALDESKLEGLLHRKSLDGELILPAEGAAARPSVQPLGLSQSKKGLFEARWTVLAAGEYRARVTDPISRQPVECTFQVVGTPVERQRAVRDVELQSALAAETGGKSFELKDVGRLPHEIHPPAKTELSVAVISLANTWLAFGLVVGLLLSEWLGRKWVNLP